MTPGRGHFWPQGYNLNKLGKCSPGDATYQNLYKYINIKALGLMVSDKKIFYGSPYISLCKTCDTRSGATFGPWGIIWTNLVKVH